MNVKHSVQEFTILFYVAFISFDVKQGDKNRAIDCTYFK
jgi:hypothetical protein